MLFQVLCGFEPIFYTTHPNEEPLNKLWNEALDYAGSKFDSLPVSKRLNGFYLQELMHRYVELLGNVVTENKEN